MPNRPVFIESFSDLPGVAEIVGVGGLRQPRGEAQEVEIEIIVASGMDRSDFRPSTHVSTHWIGCGQLDLLIPGSQWRDGERAGLAPGTSVAGTFEIVRKEMIGTGVFPQPRGQPFPSASFAKVSGFLLRRVSSGGDPGSSRAMPPPSSDPQLVLLPPFELLRALFGVSNGFLLELFDGIRSPAVSGERGLVSRKHSQVHADGTVVLSTGRNLSRDEAIMAAAVISDEALRKLHDSAFQQLSVNPDARDGRSIYLDLAWPWRTPVQMRMVGRWVDRDGANTRFIVQRIEAIGIPLPFNRVVVRHPGSEKGEQPDLPPAEGRSRSANANIVVLTTGRAASTARRPVEVRSGTLELTTANDIEVVSEACGAGIRHDRASLGEDRRDAAPFGSGGRKPGADPQVGAATVTRRSRNGDTPGRSAMVALQMTWKALVAACASQGWSLSALPRGGGSKGDPSHGGFDFAQEPLLVRVEANSKFAFVIDRGSPSGDECSLGILVPNASGSRSSELGLVIFARKLCTSVNGRWRTRSLRGDPPPHFKLTAVNRTSKLWQSESAYADMLALKIASALGI